MGEGRPFQVAGQVSHPPSLPFPETPLTKDSATGNTPSTLSHCPEMTSGSQFPLLGKLKMLYGKPCRATHKMQFIKQLLSTRYMLDA